MKFTCCKQELHWRSSNLGQEVLTKYTPTPFVKTQVSGCRWEQLPWEHIHTDMTDTACCLLCRDRGVATDHPTTATTNPPEDSVAQRGGRSQCFAYALKHKDLWSDGNTQVQVPLLCWLIKMLFIKSRKREHFLWVKHSPVLCMWLLECCHWSRDQWYPLHLFHRQHLADSVTVHSFGAMLKQLPKHTKRSTTHKPQCLKEKPSKINHNSPT